jgi:hypothetical protein
MKEDDIYFFVGVAGAIRLLYVFETWHDSIYWPYNRGTVELDGLNDPIGAYCERRLVCRKVFI